MLSKGMTFLQLKWQSPICCWKIIHFKPLRVDIYITCKTKVTMSWAQWQVGRGREGGRGVDLSNRKAPE